MVKTNQWENDINKLNLSRYFKDNVLKLLVDFLKLFGKNLCIIKTDTVELNNSFTNIGDFHNMIIAFDIEFQNALVDELNKSISSRLITQEDYYKVASFIGEFGAVFFIKDMANNWYYVGSTFIDFPSILNHGIPHENIRYYLSKYTQVSEKNNGKMIDNDDHFMYDDLINEFFIDLEKFKEKDQQINLIRTMESYLENDYIIKTVLPQKNYNDLIHNLGKLRKYYTGQIIINDTLLSTIKNNIVKSVKNIPFNIFPKHIKNTYYKQIIYDQYDIYWNDPLIIKRTISKKDEHKFLEIFTQLTDYSSVIVKGNRDIEAIHNTITLVKPDIKNNKNCCYNVRNRYDIEIFNRLSKQIYGNAQLETTYNGLTTTKIYEENAKKFFDKLVKLVGDKAHNPATDALFSTVVAIVINLIINYYFEKIEKI